MGVTLLLCFHNHQPQGNFESVFEEGEARCYGPLLDAIDRHPGVRVSMHYSGPLIEWLERHRPAHFDTLARLVERGQVELLGGGFYEPMLSVLPDDDALGQLVMAADFLERRVGVRPAGMWLAERVWEPDLARLIAAAGYRYTLLDDNHFLAAGLTRPLTGYRVTDKAGAPLALFPISQALRYAIPFAPAEEAIGKLLAMDEAAAGAGEVIVTYGDDGEKFGMWPDTHAWVWEKGWLDRFLGLLSEQAPRIATSTFTDVLAEHRPAGRVYIPTGSYREMGEWTLPPAAQARFEAATAHIASAGHEDDWGPFLRGGIWQGFLARYPESNFMHKRMCLASEMVARARERARVAGPDAEEAVARAERELYRGQCNCAYWHGLFGGLYLGKLRNAVHHHLILAETAAEQALPPEIAARVEVRDIDGDLADETRLVTAQVAAVVAPEQGGALLALDHRAAAFCVSDVLTRRPEAYHRKIRELAARRDAGEADGGGPRSIHDRAELKDPTLADALAYDPHRRLPFVDRLLPAGTTAAELLAGAAPDLAPLPRARYRAVAFDQGDAASVDLRGEAPLGGGRGRVTVAKGYTLAGATLSLRYAVAIEGDPPGDACFAVELPLVLPCGPHESGRLRLVPGAEGEPEELPLTATATRERIGQVVLRDPFAPLTLTVHLSPAATVISYPVETASQSESGFERTYQGTALTFLWPCHPGGEAETRPQVRLILG